MDAYEEGQKAQKDGRQFYENPYSEAGTRKDDFVAWFAGWCFEKQIKSGTLYIKKRD